MDAHEIEDLKEAFSVVCKHINDVLYGFYGTLEDAADNKTDTKKETHCGV
jgi:hypothetical protein